MRKIATISLLALTPLFASAQKIAFADINSIIGVLPENKKVNEDLQIYATGLQKRLDDLKAQQDVFVQQFQAALAKKDTATAIQIQEKAMEGEKNLQETARQSEMQLQQRRNEMMQPHIEKVQKAIEKIAKRDGFTYVLNSIDGSGTSALLYGPDNHNITMEVVKELGIKLEAPQGAAPAPDKKK